MIREGEFSRQVIGRPYLNPNAGDSYPPTRPIYFTERNNTPAVPISPYLLVGGYQCDDHNTTAPWRIRGTACLRGAE